jgi:hypothetical protein
MSKPASVRSEIFGLKNAVATSDRRYKRWTEEEVVKLLSLVRKKKTVQEMADLHQRTNTSIKSKLRSIATDYYFSGRTVEEISKWTGLTVSEVTNAVAAKQASMPDVVATVVSLPAAHTLAASSPVMTPASPVVTAETHVTPVVTAETPVVTAETPVVTAETPVVTDCATDCVTMRHVMCVLLDIQNKVRILESDPTLKDLMAIATDIQGRIGRVLSKA